MMPQTVMPEWLERRDFPNGPWSVQIGQPVRGDAWTNTVERVMRAPDGNDPASRVIRAHEMMHARVSPKDGFVTALDAFKGLNPEALRAAEEYRVNVLIGVAGFNLGELSDGSEATWGKRLAEAKDWNAIVTSIAALAGTKGSADFIRGIKTVDAGMAKSARAVEKAVIAHWRKVADKYILGTGKRGRKALTPEAEKRGAKIIGSTEADAHGLPRGFIRFTIPLAIMLDGLLLRDDGTLAETGKGDMTDDLMTVEDIEDIINGGKAGHFARLMVDHNVPLTRRVDGKLGRKRVAAVSGRNPRRIERLLTDPERRVFDRKIKGKGGVVIIDQSGSMSLAESELWEIIAAAPGCTVVGYSHLPGSTTTPNVWVLADRGKVCEAVRSGNSGNGVDGPALKFALSKRRNNEPVIWVCDGVVTDGQEDLWHANLGEACVRLVIANGIHMVETVQGAVEALSKAGRGSLPTTVTGMLQRTAAWRNRGRAV